MPDICKKGHPILIWGQTDTGTCRACTKDSGLKRTYGITLLEFVRLWIFQNGRCAVCGALLKLGLAGEGTRIEVDHKHGSKGPIRNTVRGLLCGGRWAGCNRKLGRLDKAEWLEAARDYVLNPPAKEVLNLPEESTFIELLKPFVGNQNEIVAPNIH